MEAVTSVRPRGCDFTLEVAARHRGWYEVEGYEPYTTTLFRIVCERADVIVDIGAHIGYYAVLGARANPAARVIAVEASPQNCEVLSRNTAAALPNHVEVINAAFGSFEGTVWLELTEASDNSGLTAHPDSPTIERVQVAAITGSALKVPPGQRVVIKIDIEGQELGALEGLEQLLHESADPRLFVELNPRCLRGAGQTPDSVVAWLLDHEFRVFAVDERAWEWRELQTAASWTSVLDEASYLNLYCVPRGFATSVSAVVHSASLFGAERAHVELTRELVANGFMVHTIMPGPDFGLAEEARQAGSSVSLVDAMPRWMEPAGTSASDGTLDTWVHPSLIQALSGTGADLVLTQTVVIAQGAIAAAVLGVPHVWYLHEFGDLDHDLRLPVPPAEVGGFVAGLSDAVITNSRAVREHFFPNDPDAATVVYPARRIQPASDQVAQRERPWTLGIVASLQPGKGHSDAIAAVAELRRSGLEIPLVLLGSGSPADIDRLAAFAQDNGVSDLMSFAGAVQDRAAVYATIDAVAVTSRSEAFGLVPFEASAAGLPVIYASAGGLLEYMRPGVTGLPYAPGDSHALAVAIRSLVGDQTLQHTLVANARETFARFFVESQAQATELQSILRKIAVRARPKPFQPLLQAIGMAATTTLAQRDDAVAQRDDAVAQRDEAIKRARNIESSRTWRYSSWYRGLRARLRRR